MIDIENAVYTQVRNAIKDVFSNVDISNEYTDNPASFPHVSFEMSDNAVHAPSMTANCREFAANQTFTANVYTTSAQRKSDAKAIADVIDGVMAGLGFRRAIALQTPNMDRNIYRYTMRYTGLVSLGYDGEAKHYKITAR